ANGASGAGERRNPNVNGFSAALSCYPIVRQLASQLDLNSLHDLSRTCRQFRANLLEYRGQLVKHTLHCCNEDASPGPQPESPRQLTSGRVGKCARDMVGECQRCGVVVCRNCNMKPPATPILRARHRRLCRTCNKAPLPQLLAVYKPRATSSSTSSIPGSPSLRHAFLDSDTLPSRAFTTPAFERTPCNCDNVVWLCAPCGKDLRRADTMYVQAWSWRTTYSYYMGGQGTGAGEGNEGVKCGRGSACLGARIVEHETCEQDLLDALAAQNGSPDAAERWSGTSYHAQEIEGIGGVLKVKHKKQVRVGECVKLYEDEREKAVRYLEREVIGKLRSWCSWCERIVLGEKDKALLAGRPTSSCSTSTSSSK
ncbi:hypothetical protein EK21DRAFT_22562, partial [Setomelanomma holmii]